MAGGPHDSSLTRVQPFFEALIARDPSGRSWLPQLLHAAPNGAGALGELCEDPGWLEVALAVHGQNGKLTCFEFPAAASKQLLTWFIDHPEELEWPANADLSPGTVRLRRALLYDDPPGARVKAQERARDHIPTASLFAQDWWQFEGTTRLDCALMTDRLVIIVEGKRTEPLSSATAWYPRRSQLVQNLEAAKHLAKARGWGSLLISERLLPEGSDEYLERTLPASAPHLTAAEREELHAGYLGNITWQDACAAVGLPLQKLPDTAPVP